jgi:hypothetical protein
MIDVLWHSCDIVMPIWQLPADDHGSLFQSNDLVFG